MSKSFANFPSFPFSFSNSGDSGSCQENYKYTSVERSILIILISLNPCEIKQNASKLIF